jgi:hypothetical protein
MIDLQDCHPDDPNNMTQGEYDAMITGTSGVSGLTGGNCTKEEHEAYQRLLAQITPPGYPPPTREESLAADLQTPYHRFAAVFRREGVRLSDDAHAQMETALTELASTINALNHPA